MAIQVAKGTEIPKNLNKVKKSKKNRVNKFLPRMQKIVIPTAWKLFLKRRKIGKLNTRIRIS